MEKRHVKQSFLGFSHEVKPIQRVFHSECADADLNADVLQVFSELQKLLIGEMMNGACALSRHRNSEDVTPEDLLRNLDTQWKVDPLLVSVNYHNVAETAEKNDISVPANPFHKKEGIGLCENYPRRQLQKTSAPKKTTTKKLKLSKKNTAEENAEARERNQEIIRRNAFQLPLDDLFEKRKTQTPDIAKFSGNECKQSNLDCVPQPTPVAATCKISVPTNHLHKKKRIDPCDDAKKTTTKQLRLAKKITAEELADPYKKNRELIRRIALQLPLDDLFEKPKTQTPDITKFSGNECKQSNFDYVPQPSPVAATYKVEKNASTYDSKKKFHPSFTTQVEYASDAESKQFEESIYKPISMLSCDSKMKGVFFEEKTVFELKAEKQPSIEIPCQNKLLVMPGTNLEQTASGIYAVCKQPSTAVICDTTSKIEKKMATCDGSLKFCTKDNSKREIIVTKQPSIEMQAFKMPVEEKQEKSVKCAFVENQQLETQPSIKTACLKSQESKIPIKNYEKKELAIKDVPAETPEEARKKHAIILLRIAGKYR